MSKGENARRENWELCRSAPAWARGVAPGLRALHWVRRAWHGCYRQSPFSYAIYTRDQPTRRVEFHVPRPTFFWKRQ